MIVDDESVHSGGQMQACIVAPGVVVTRRAIVQGLVASLGMLAIGCRGPTLATGPTTRRPLEQFVAELRPTARRLLAVPGGASAADEEIYLRTVAAALAQVEPEAAWRKGSGRVAMGMLAYMPPVFVYEIVMAPGAIIEWHDHRDYNGALTPLEGSVSVRHAHFATEMGAHRSVFGGVPQERFHVRVGGEAALSRGQVATLARDRDNLHEVIAGRDGARLLDCFTHFTVGARSFGLVLEPEPIDTVPGLHRARWKT